MKCHISIVIFKLSFILKTNMVNILRRNMWWVGSVISKWYKVIMTAKPEVTGLMSNTPVQGVV